MKPQLVREKVFCGVDIGSQRIKVAIVRAPSVDRLELLGASDIKTHGFRDGAVNDLGALSERIHTAVDVLSKECKVKLRDVHVGIPGNVIETRQASTIIPLVDKGSKVITEHSITKVSAQARLLSLRMDDEVLHELPQSYQVDEVTMVTNPRGLYARKLGVRSFLIVANSNHVRNITKAINQAGYDVSSISLSSYAAAAAIVHPEAMDAGCVVVDIGSQSTTIVIVRKGIVYYVDTIALGGESISHRIAQQLNLPFDLAEHIKKSQSGVAIPEAQLQEEVLVKRDQAYCPIRRADIQVALEAAVDDLISSVRNAIDASGYKTLVTGGIVMTGGGVLLSGLIERMAQQISLPVRLGSVYGVSATKVYPAALYASAVGLSRRGLPRMPVTTAAAQPTTPWQKFTAKFIEVYQEYF